MTKHSVQVKHPTPDGELTFGPAYNKEFLLALRQLTTNITEVSVTEDNECFAEKDLLLTVLFAPTSS